MNEKDLIIRHMRVTLGAGAISVSEALSEIKRGRVDRSVVLLERQLDRCVMCLDLVCKNAEPSDKLDIIGDLRMIRNYRRRHPRPIEPEPNRVKNGEVDHITDVQESARKILEALEG